jgi:CBS domain-containing protein
MKVSEIMTTNPACCVPSDAAQTAAVIMRDEDTGIVPVVENKRSRKLVGVVTDRDLCIGVIAGRPQITDAGLDPTNAPIEQFMTAQVVTCSSNDDLEEVLAVMRENQVRRVLIVDHKNDIQGVVSLSDLMMRGAVPKGETHQTLKSISKPTGEASKPRAQSANPSSK